MILLFLPHAAIVGLIAWALNGPEIGIAAAIWGGGGFVCGYLVRSA